MEFMICGVPFLGTARPRSNEILSLNKATFIISGICVTLSFFSTSSEVLDIK